MSLESVGSVGKQPPLHEIVPISGKAAVEPESQAKSIAKAVANVGLMALKGLSAVTAIVILASFAIKVSFLTLAIVAAAIVVGAIALGILRAIHAARTSKQPPQEVPKMADLSLAEIELTLLAPTPVPKRVSFDTTSLNRAKSELEYSRKLRNPNRELAAIHTTLSTFKQASLDGVPTTLYPLDEKLHQLKREFEAVEEKISSKEIKERIEEQVAYIDYLSNVLIVLRESLSNNTRSMSANVARAKLTLNSYREKAPKAPAWDDLDTLLNRMESRLGAIGVEQGG